MINRVKRVDQIGDKVAMVTRNILSRLIILSGQFFESCESKWSG